MRKGIEIIYFFSLLALLGMGWGFAQGTNFQANTTFFIGRDVIFYTPSNTTFGTLKNHGKIVSEKNLNFNDNDSIGTVEFVGMGNREMVGRKDSMIAKGLITNFEGDLTIRTQKMIVTDLMQMNKGVILAKTEDALVVNVNVIASKKSHIDNQMSGYLRDNSPAVFPLAANGVGNHLTFSDFENKKNIFFYAKCEVPPSSHEFVAEKNQDIISITDEIYWEINSNGSSLDAKLTFEFNGLDFNNPVTIKHILADQYGPAILLYDTSKSDGYVVLTSDVTTFDNSNLSSSSGTIRTVDKVTIDSLPKFFSIGWIPVVDDSEFFIPNAFRPGAVYEENKTFRPFFYGEKLKYVSIQVFNTFNTIVYSYESSASELNLENIGWDGTLSAGNAPADEGVYYYIIKIGTATGKIRQKAGSVMLKR